MDKKQEKVGKFQVKQIGDEADRTLEFIGTDETEDRDGDVIKADGWMFENYMKNPVFLPFHDSCTVPVAKCVGINKSPGLTGVSFKIKFASIEELSSNPATPSREALLADTLYNAYKNGYMNAVSIGFIPLEHEENESNKDLPQWERGRIFTSQEMIELSAVAIPANPNALIQARSFKGWKDSQKQVSLLESIFTKSETQEPDMKPEQVAKAISDAVAPLMAQIANLEGQTVKAGAKHSAATIEKMQTTLDHMTSAKDVLDKGYKTLKGLMDGDGEEPGGQNPGELEPGTDRDGNTPPPGGKSDDNDEDDAGGKAYGINLSKVDLKLYESA